MPVAHSRSGCTGTICIAGDAAQGDTVPEAEVDPDWVPDADAIGPFEIVALFPHPKDGNRFVLSAAGAASRYLFDCCLGEEDARAVPGMSGTVTCAQHSANGLHYLMGSCDGAVRVVPVDFLELPQQESTFWEAQVHSMHSRVTSVCMTFDGTHVISAASDGSMFTHKVVADVLKPGQHQLGAGLERFCSMEEVEMEEGEDTVDVNTYTIEQAKQRLEADAVEAASEAKKATVREAVAQCGSRA